MLIYEALRARDAFTTLMFVLTARARIICDMPRFLHCRLTFVFEVMLDIYSLIIFTPTRVIFISGAPVHASRVRVFLRFMHFAESLRAFSAPGYAAMPLRDYAEMPIYLRLRCARR